jgi:hypothetical protein
MNEESKPADSSSEALSLMPATRKGMSWLPVIVLCVVFLAGFAPMWLKTSRLAAELHRAQRALRLETIQLTLANAALAARRGDYEPARQGMTTFFSLVTTELERGIGSALPSGGRADFETLLAQRDDLITLLARSDAAAAERLAAVYAGFRKSLGK